MRKDSVSDLHRARIAADRVARRFRDLDREDAGKEISCGLGAVIRLSGRGRWASVRPMRSVQHDRPVGARGVIAGEHPEERAPPPEPVPLDIEAKPLARTKPRRRWQKLDVDRFDLSREERLDAIVGPDGAVRLLLRCSSSQPRQKTEPQPAPADDVVAEPERPLEEDVLVAGELPDRHEEVCVRRPDHLDEQA